MSIRTGILTHEIVDLKSEKVIYKGSKKECEMFLKRSLHPDAHANYVIVLDREWQGRNVVQTANVKKPKLPMKLVPAKAVKAPAKKVKK